MQATARRRALVRPALVSLAALAVVAASAFVARRLLFSTFRPWDDEGYMLLIVREYARHGGLYDRIQTPYAPLFFEAVAGLHRFLGVALDNVLARHLALVIWIGASLGCSALVLRETRSVLFAFIAWVLVFPILMALNAEPMHPGQGIVLLLPLVAIAALAATASGGARWATAGVLAGAILCIKLNVGTYVLLAFAGEFLRRSGRFGRAALFVLAAFPLALMAPLFAKAWVQELAWIAAVSLGSVAAVAWFAPAPAPLRTRDVAAFAGGALLAGVLALGIAFATGTTPAGLWNGLVLETVRVPSVFFARATLPSIVFVAPPLALLAVAAALHREGVPRSPKAALAIAALKCAGAIAALVIGAGAHRFLGALPCLGLLSLPTRERDGGVRDRWTLALLAGFVALQVYPVAGSQMNFSAFLLPSVALVALHDGGRVLAGIVRFPWRLERALAPVGALVLLAFHPFYPLVPEWMEFWGKFVPLGLPGAASIRLPEADVATQRWLAANIRANGTTFFGEPGLDSLYIWTGTEPPVPFYSHMWMVQTPIERQRPVAAAIAGRKDVCVVRNRGIVETWLQGRPLADSPILEAIESGYEVAGRTRGYELLLPRGRTPDLVLSARRVAIPAPIATVPEERFALALSFPAMPGAKVARIEVFEPEEESVLFEGLPVVEPDGREAGLPFALDERRTVLLVCPHEIAEHKPDTILVRAFDESGAVVARLPLVR